MPFTNDMQNSVIDRIRLKVGDTDEYDEGLTDEIYEYLYETNDENENKAAFEALRMLVFKYAKYVTEKAGGLFAKENERYNQYKELFERVSKDPTWSFLETGLPFAGGISTEERVCNPSSNPFSLGSNKRRYVRANNPLRWIGGRGWNNYK